jgi:hypothetical protein
LEKEHRAGGEQMNELDDPGPDGDAGDEGWPTETGNASEA